MPVQFLGSKQHGSIVTAIIFADVFVLFAYGVDPEDPVFPDFQDPDALGDFTPPAGWTYSTRVLEEELVLASEDKATVLAFRTKVGQNSTWEKR